MFSKKGTRFLIFVVLLASCFIMTLSTNALPHFTKLNLWAHCKVGTHWWNPWDSKTHAEADLYYNHAVMAGNLMGQHFHRFSYALYARVAEDVQKNPDHGGYGNMTINSLKRFWPFKKKIARASGYPRWENDAYASVSASEKGNPTNWAFCPKPKDVN